MNALYEPGKRVTNMEILIIFRCKLMDPIYFVLQTQALTSVISQQTYVTSKIRK